MITKKGNEFITVSEEINYYGIELQWNGKSRVLEFNNNNLDDMDDVLLEYSIDPDVKYLNEFNIILLSEYVGQDIKIGSIATIEIPQDNINDLYLSYKVGKSNEIDSLIKCLSKQKLQEEGLFKRILYIKSIELYPEFRGLELGDSIIKLLLETYTHVNNINFSSCILALGPSRGMSYPEYEDENGELSESDFKKLRTRLRGFYKRIGFVKWKTKDGYQFLIKNLNKDRV